MSCRSGRGSFTRLQLPPGWRSSGPISTRPGSRGLARRLFSPAVISRLITGFRGRTSSSSTLRRNWGRSRAACSHHVSRSDERLRQEVRRAMKRWLLAAILIGSASAHRLDEYLQGTILSVDKNRMDAQIVLTPGVAVFPEVIADIDTNGDGTISDAEQRAYAAKVLGDLSIAIDGEPLTPRIYSMRFPAIDDMKEGRGEIQLQFRRRSSARRTEPETHAGKPSRKPVLRSTR